MRRAAAQCERGGGPGVHRNRLAARGLAVGDYDNDGCLDVLVGEQRRAPVLLHNNAGAGNHWLGMKLEGVKCNRDAIGARITWSAGGVRRTRVEERRRQLSFFPRSARSAGTGSGGEGRLAGNPLAGAQRARSDRYTDLPVDRYMEIVEGKNSFG